MKRLALVGVVLVALSGLGLVESASAAPLRLGANTEAVGADVGPSHGTVTSNAVRAGSDWTYYDLSAWPSPVSCEVIVFHAQHLYSGSWGDDGTWKSSGKTVTMTIPGGHLKPGTFKGVLTVEGNFVGLLSNRGLTLSGPEELAPGSDPSGIGTCAPES